MPKKRGRPIATLIDNPSGAREEGRARLQARLRAHARSPTYDGRPKTPPKVPTDRFDEGLIYASNAGLIAPQAAKGVADKARKLRATLAGQPPTSGPAFNADQAVELSQAIETVLQIRRKFGLPVKPARAREIREVLLLLFDEDVSEATIRQRRKRLRDRLEAIKAIRAENRRRTGS